MARSLVRACGVVLAFGLSTACVSYGPGASSDDGLQAPADTAAAGQEPATPPSLSSGSAPDQTSPGPVTPPPPTGCDPLAPFTNITPLPSAGKSEGGARWDATKSNIVFTRGVDTPSLAMGSSLVDATGDAFGSIADSLGIMYPALSPDGLTLFYAAASQDQDGWYSDIFTATRSSTTGSFQNGAPLDAAGYSGTDYEPYVVSTGKTLYYTHLDPSDGTDYIKQWSLTTTAPLLEVLSAPNDSLANPVVSADELTLYYAAYRSSSYDLFVAKRTSTTEPFSTGVQMPSFGSPSVDEHPTWISDDQCQMLFESDSVGSNGKEQVAMMLATR